MGFVVFSLAAALSQFIHEGKSSTKALSFKESEPPAPLTKGLCQRGQAATISCCELRRLHIVLHLALAIRKTRTRFTWSPPWEAVIKPTAYMDDDVIHLCFARDSYVIWT